MLGATQLCARLIEIDCKLMSVDSKMVTGRTELRTVEFV